MIVDPQYQTEVSGWNLSERENENGYTEIRVLQKKENLAPKNASHAVLELAGHDVEGWLARGYLVDHKNRDTTDNRLENLRFVTPRVNAFNKPKKCVRYIAGGYQVRVRVPWAPKDQDGRSKRLERSFKTLPQAEAFRDQTIKQCWDWFYENGEAVDASL